MEYKAVMFRQRKLMFEVLESFVANRNLCEDKKQLLQEVEAIYL